MIELKIDWDEKIKDGKKFVEEFKQRFDFIDFIYPEDIVFQDIKVLETKKGFHFYLKVKALRKIKDIEIVCFQMMLGSDYRREGFNMIRVLEGNTSRDRWNLLFLDKEFISSASILLEGSLKSALFGLIEKQE